MRKIVDNLLYDTDTAELIYSDDDGRRKRYKTPNGRFFTLYRNGTIQANSENEMKAFLGEHDIEKYEELFGVPEEA